MSIQETLTEIVNPGVYRSIVKDAYSTDDGGGDARLEVAAWQVKIPSEDDDEPETIKEDDGTLDYSRILQIALADLGADEISERTELKSYRDDRGGRAASTIRGYRRNAGRLAPKDRGGLPSSHPVKRVLRRYARSNDLGHYQDDQSTESDDAVPIENPDLIDMDALKSAYRLARLTASINGFVFVPETGEPEAVEDNERIDRDEIRKEDRPTGEIHAGILLTKPSGKKYEYRVDLDSKDLDPVQQGANIVPKLPPGGY